MSYFAVCISEILKRHEETQSDLARKTGLSPAHISNLINGTQTWVSPADLEAIALNITSEARERAELLCAHLRDECHGPGSELIEIRVGNKPVEIHERAPYAPLPPKLERDFAILRKHSDNKALRTLLDGLADLLDDEPNSPGQKAAADIVAAAIDDVKSGRATTRPKPPTEPVRYKVPRRSKKRPPGGDNAT